LSDTVTGSSLRIQLLLWHSQALKLQERKGSAGIFFGKLSTGWLASTEEREEGRVLQEEEEASNDEAPLHLRLRGTS
jgi:hypothetical protein